ncbi:MAG: neutral zinc metallopeptidase, partial [Paracoccaceae bacterium]
MKWRGRRTSANIEDRRHRGGGRAGSMVRGRGGRIGGIGAVLVILVGMFFGVDVSALLGGGSNVLGFSVPQGTSSGVNQVDDEMEEFVAVVLADTEEVWTDVFRQMGRTYSPPTLVLFSGKTSSSCGSATVASGPFYCPADQRAYL